MKLPFTLLLLALLAMAAGAQQKPPSTSPQSEKQKAAEEAADRVMRRFYETLDFGVVYREMYVSDPLKHMEVQTTIAQLLMDDDLKVPPIDFAAMERAYIAKMDFDFLLSAMGFTHDGDRESLEKEMELKSEQYYMPLMSRKIPPILTAQQLDSRFTANLDHLSECLRKHVVSKNYETELYPKRVASFQESRSPETRYVESLAGRQKVYVLQRETLHIYFLEENHQFKMLSTTPRVMD